MSTRLINPKELAEAKGFSHVAVGKGAAVVLAGQIGWDKSGKIVSDDLVAQFGLALDNLLVALKAAGGEPEDLALLRIYCTRVPEYRARLRELGAAYRKRFGKHFPAMALLGVTELFTPRSLVEIEGLAFVEERGAGGPAADREGARGPGTDREGARGR